jgi:hypothetical protein
MKHLIITILLSIVLTSSQNVLGFTNLTYKYKPIKFKTFNIENVSYLVQSIKLSNNSVLKSKLFNSRERQSYIFSDWFSLDQSLNIFENISQRLSPLMNNKENARLSRQFESLINDISIYRKTPSNKALIHLFTQSSRLTFDMAYDRSIEVSTSISDVHFFILGRRYSLISAIHMAILNKNAFEPSLYNSIVHS